MTSTDLWHSITQAAQAMSLWEVTAVALSIAYLALAMRQSRLCWYAAFGSTTIYTVLFWNVSLLMESALNVYYLLMALYGWWAWRPDAPTHTAAIQSWGPKQHLLAIAAVLLLTLISGYLLTENTHAALPYLDSFTTWGAVLTTWMVARKVLENWLYWIVVDGAAALMYIDRGLYLTALLMVIYVIMVIIGWFNWLPQYRAQQQPQDGHYA